MLEIFIKVLSVRKVTQKPTIMKTAIIFLLVTAVAAQTSENCCNSYQSCRDNCNNQPNCYSDCRRDTKCCQSEQSCCNDGCTTSTPCTPQPSKPTPCTEPSCPPPPVVVNPPPPTIDCPPSVHCPPNTPCSDTHECCCGSNNTQTVTTDVKISNVLSNTNHIHIPIHITNTNINNLEAQSEGCCGSSEPGRLEIDKQVEIHQRPYPMPIPIPVPFPYPVHYPIPQQRDCCTVVQPCVNNNNGCKPYETQCGSQCTSALMYNPQNPCQGNNCEMQQQYWGRNVCYQTGQYPFANCGYQVQDCSNCDNDFYRNYNSYEQCRGCFN